MIFVALSLHPTTKYSGSRTEIYVIAPQLEISLNNLIELAPLFHFFKVCFGIKNKLYSDREINFPEWYDTTLNESINTIGQVYNVQENVSLGIIQGRAARKKKCENSNFHNRFSWNCARSLAVELKTYCEGIKAKPRIPTGKSNEITKAVFFPVRKNLLF